MKVDDYMEAGKRMPPKDAVLQTQDGDYFYFKGDILAGQVTYSTDKRMAVNTVVISAERAREIIELNKNGEKPVSLSEEGAGTVKTPIDLLADADISRFDKAKKKKKGKPNNKRNEGWKNRPKQSRTTIRAFGRPTVRKRPAPPNPLIITPRHEEMVGGKFDALVYRLP